ncbi:MAG TPA: PIG-L family deacetylase [Armatimonadota bacterium]|jgi:LmbE family N-acetylglucosaminyl deacetylase
MRFRKRTNERPRRRRVVVARVLLAVLLVAAAALGIAAWRIRQANGGVWASDLHVWPPPRRGDRILIFAPHCDDETLGLSGLTQQAVAAGADVRVVFVTNGDGFPYSAEREYQRLRLKPSDYVKFGMSRQVEALQAVAASGVARNHVTFLGYPDGGVSELWLHNWTPARPYKSRFTSRTRSPYPNSRTRNAVYCGQSVMSDIEGLVRAFHPTQVYCPHPNDNHADHWATYTFVTAALWQLRRDASAFGPAGRPPIEGLYVVHRGDWPVPQGYHPKSGLPPPAALLQADTEWKQIPITPAQAAVKLNAISKYRSQTRVMKRFLMSFVRKNELVGTRTSGPLTVVKDGALRVVDDWKDLPVSVVDPVDDTVQTEIGGSGDLSSVSVAEDSRRLYIRLELRKPISPRVAYDVYWHPLPGDASGTRGMSLRLGGQLQGRVSAVVRGNVWQIAVPRPPGDAVMVGVKCRYHRFTLDKTGWRVLEPVSGS